MPLSKPKQAVQEWFLSTFWPKFGDYGRLCPDENRGRRGEALTAMLKVSPTPDEAEMTRIQDNHDAQVRDALQRKRKGEKIKFWYQARRYIKESCWMDTIDSVSERVVDLKDCSWEGCSEEVLGPKYKHCAFHLNYGDHSTLIKDQLIKLQIKKQGSETYSQACHRHALADPAIKKMLEKAKIA